MTIFSFVVQLLLLFILLNLTNESFSKEKLAKKISKPHVLGKINQRKSNNDRRQSVKQKASLFHRIKPERMSNFTKKQSKLIKKKLLKYHKRKIYLKKKPHLIKSVSHGRKTGKIKYKKINKTGRRYRKPEKRRCRPTHKNPKRKNLKIVASPNKSRTNVYNETIEISFPPNASLKDGLIRLAKMEKMFNVSLSQNFNRTDFVRRALQRRVPEKTDYERFIANNQDMLHDKYWKRRFEAYYYKFNVAIQEAKENIRKHGKDPTKIKNKDLCHYLFDDKCYQKGEKVCTEKDSNGDCKKWYEEPFRYDKSGKVQPWLVKFWDKKPETPRELEIERNDKIEASHYDTCTLQRDPPAGGYRRTYCVPVYKILQLYPELAKRIENLYPNYSKSQNYFISDAESIVNGIINAAENKDCQLIGRLFPFLKQHFDHFSYEC